MSKKKVQEAYIPAIEDRALPPVVWRVERIRFLGFTSLTNATNDYVDAWTPNSPWSVVDNGDKFTFERGLIRVEIPKSQVKEIIYRVVETTQET